MLTQKQFVRKAYDRYKDQGLTPGDFSKGAWEQAHYPVPKGMGERWIWLLPEDHFVQGVLQSEEMGKCCFYLQTCRPFLDSNWCENWFEVFELYQKWATELGRKNGIRARDNQQGIFDPGNKEHCREGSRKAGRISGPINGPKLYEEGRGIFGRTTEQMTADGKKGGRAASQYQMKNKIGIFSPDYDRRPAASKGGKKTVAMQVGIHHPDFDHSKGYRTSKERGTGLCRPDLDRQQIARDAGKVSGQLHLQNGTGIFGRTPEQITADARKGGKIGGSKGGKISSSQKWISTKNGFISTAGNVAQNNKRIGDDPASRIKLTDDQYNHLKNIPQNQRLAALENLTPVTT